MTNPRIYEWSARGGLACARTHSQAYYQEIGRRGGCVLPRPSQPPEQWHWIKRARLGLGISQAALAERLGVSRDVVRDWETGRRQTWRGREEEVERALGMEGTLTEGQEAAR